MKEEETIVVTEDNAEEIARKEMKEEAKANEDERKELEEGKEEVKDEGKETTKETEKVEEKTKEEIIKEEEKPKELTKEELEAQEKEHKRLLEADEKDLSDEDKENKKVVLLQRETAQKEAFDVRVKDYSKSKEISEKDARETLESIDSIVTKYEKNPEKIAEANLGLQRLVSQKDEEVRATKELASQPPKPQSAKEWERFIMENGLPDVKGKDMTWEEIVSNYRKENDDTTKDLEDGQVLKLVAKEIHTKSEVYFEKLKVDIKAKADEKRGKLVASIPEVSKQFTDDVKTLLSTVSDAVIMYKDYDIEPSIRWARGKYYSPDKVAELLKEAELKGFERGKASGKVITGVIGKGKTPKGKGVVTVTPKQKGEALDMFPNVPEEEAINLYLDVQKSRAKNLKKKE